MGWGYETWATWPLELSVTALVDRLERAGHVHRIRDETDRRRVVLQPSDTALAAGGTFFGGLQRELLAALADYSTDELAVVRRFLVDATRVVEGHEQQQDGAREPGGRSGAS